MADHLFDFESGKSACGVSSTGCGVQTYLLSDNQCKDCRKIFEARQAVSDQVVKPRFPRQK